jgi:hypothetical protein
VEHGLPKTCEPTSAHPAIGTLAGCMLARGLSLLRSADRAANVFRIRVANAARDHATANEMQQLAQA